MKRGMYDSGVASTHFEIFGNVYKTKGMTSRRRKRRNRGGMKTTSYLQEMKPGDRPNNYDQCKKAKTVPNFQGIAAIVDCLRRATVPIVQLTFEVALRLRWLQNGMDKSIHMVLGSKGQ